MKLHRLFECKYKVAVAIVYDDSGNVLLGRATNSDDRKGKWCFPAGGLKPGEKVEDAAVRECLEETGITAVSQQPAFSYFLKPNAGVVVCRKVSGEFNPNSEFSELKWVPWDKILEVDGLYPPIAELMREPLSELP